MLYPIRILLLVAVWCNIICPTFNQTISNDLAHEFVGQTLQTEDNIKARGYKGFFGRSTSVTARAFACDASYSCASMLSFYLKGTYAECRGSHSCSNDTILIKTDDAISTEISCSGSNSCSFSNITGNITGVFTDPTLRCYGYQSCSFTYIQSIGTINAYGSHALFKAIIDTTHNITIYLNGYLSGYSALLRCREGSTCDIHCNYYNACYMFHIDCVGKCILHKASVNYIAPIYDISQYNKNMDSIHMNHIHTLFNSSFIESIDKTICDRIATNYDDSGERRERLIAVNSSALCCRGTESCDRSNITSYVAHNQLQFVVCSGSNACIDTVMQLNNDTVICAGEGACYFSEISDVSIIYCLGVYSCMGSKISRSNSIICSGSWSCSNSILESAGHDLNIYFDGYRSGSKVDIYCNANDTCNIYCRAKGSCMYDPKVHCNINGTCNINVFCDEITYCPVDYPPNWYQYLQRSTTSTNNPTQMLTIESATLIGETVIVSKTIHDDYTFSDSIIILIIGTFLLLAFVFFAYISIINKKQKQRKKNENQQKRSEIEQWLTDVVKLPKCYPIFIDHGYDSLQSIILNIKEEKALENMGIVSYKQRAQIMKEINVLKARENKHDIERSNKLLDEIEGKKQMNVLLETVEGHKNITIRAMKEDKILAGRISTKRGNNHNSNLEGDNVSVMDKRNAELTDGAKV